MTRHETPSVRAEGPRFAPREVRIEKRPDGTLVLRSPIEFEPPKWSILDFIPEWAEKAPQRAFLAQRGRDGEWQRISYAELWQRVRSVGQAMIDLGAKRGDRLAILSGNSIEQAIVMFAAMSVLVPTIAYLIGGLGFGTYKGSFGTIVAFIGVGALYVFVIALITPLPGFLLDLLIVTDILMSVTVLMVSLYLVRPVEFTSFPTTLLLLTLAFRPSGLVGGAR